MGNEFFQKFSFELFNNCSRYFSCCLCIRLIFLYLIALLISLILFYKFLQLFFLFFFLIDIILRFFLIYDISFNISISRLHFFHKISQLYRSFYQNINVWGTTIFARITWNFLIPLHTHLFKYMFSVYSWAVRYHFLNNLFEWHLLLRFTSVALLLCLILLGFLLFALVFLRILYACLFRVLVDLLYSVG